MKVSANDLLEILTRLPKRPQQYGNQFRDIIKGPLPRLTQIDCSKPFVAKELIFHWNEHYEHWELEI